MRIAIDIDSTLHHYWDELADSAKRRFGVELPYDQQHTWKISRLRDEQLRAVIADTHSDAAIARARAVPGRGRDRQRVARGRPLDPHHQPPRRALPPGHEAAGWPPSACSYDDLHCSYDKVSRCVELDIDVLIDDSPVTLGRALENGMVAATLVHPWNRELCEEEADVVCAEDWPGLAAALELRLPRLRRAA